MKVTKTSAQHNGQILARRLANKDCNICPCCGETKSTMDYAQRGITDKGILGGLCSNFATGFFKIKVWQVDKYYCYTCGAEWESDPYEI